MMIFNTSFRFWLFSTLSACLPDYQLQTVRFQIIECNKTSNSIWKPFNEIIYLLYLVRNADRLESGLYATQDK